MSCFASTPMDVVESCSQDVRDFFDTHDTFSAAYRKSQLAALARMLENNKEEFIDAMVRDFKNKDEAQLEFYQVIASCVDAINNVDAWMAPQSVSKPLTNATDSAFLHPDPLGVALIIAPWNYPIGLLLEPLVGAIAAGCCAILKPSEITEHTAAKLASIVPRYLDQRAYRIVNGGVAETTALLAQKWDHIFYTGNGHVGRIVMRAAAEHLTPVTLELGGKSPCIVTEGANVLTCANRIMSGKFLNCGQTCIAPDYVLVLPHLKDALLYHMQAYLESRYGDIMASPDYASLPSRRHMDRIVRLLKQTKGRIVYGGASDVARRLVGPTLVTDIESDDMLMQEEIFGPILPVITIPSFDAAVDFINAGDKPLALYAFCSRNQVEHLLRHTSSGGVTVHDTVMHYTVPNLPFGGVGASGIGGYHGKRSFDVFSHAKSVLWRSSGFESLNTQLRYPPYKGKVSLLLRILYGKTPAWVLNPLTDWTRHGRRRWFRKASLLALACALLYSWSRPIKIQ